MLASKFVTADLTISSITVSQLIMQTLRVKTLMASHVSYIQELVTISKVVSQNTIQMMVGIVMQHMVQLL